MNLSEIRMNCRRWCYCLHT